MERALSQCGLWGRRVGAMREGERDSRCPRKSSPARVYLRLVTQCPRNTPADELLSAQAEQVLAWGQGPVRRTWD